jgi:hypothetical protein
VIALLVIESWPEAGEDHRSRLELPFAVMLPQIPGTVDLDRAVVQLKFGGRLDQQTWIRERREGALQKRRLRVFNRVNTQHRAALRKLRERKNAQHLLKVLKHVGFVESSNPEGKIKAVRHGRFLIGLYPGSQ